MVSPSNEERNRVWAGGLGEQRSPGTTIRVYREGYLAKYLRRNGKYTRRNGLGFWKVRFLKGFFIQDWQVLPHSAHRAGEWCWGNWSWLEHKHPQLQSAWHHQDWEGKGRSISRNLMKLRKCQVKINKSGWREYPIVDQHVFLSQDHWPLKRSHQATKGWNFFTLAFTLRNIRKMLRGQPMEDMHPWYKAGAGFQTPGWWCYVGYCYGPIGGVSKSDPVENLWFAYCKVFCIFGTYQKKAFQWYMLLLLGFWSSEQHGKQVHLALLFATSCPKKLAVPVARKSEFRPFFCSKSILCHWYPPLHDYTQIDPIWCICVCANMTLAYVYGACLYLTLCLLISHKAGWYKAISSVEMSGLYGLHRALREGGWQVTRERSSWLWLQKVPGKGTKANKTPQQLDIEKNIGL